MPLWQTILCFGIPGVLIAAGFLVILPALQRAGMDRAYAYTLVEVIFVGGLAPAAIIGTAMEGRPLNSATVRSRLRLKPLTPQHWNWLTIGILAFIGSYYAGLWISTALIRQFGLTFPNTTFPLDTGSLVNRALWIVNLLVGLIGEELWWRGYVLPRQELVFGQRTWLLHGLLWALVHAGYSGWYTIALIIPCCVVPFIVQGLKNTTAGITMQVFLNIFNLLIGGL